MDEEEPLEVDLSEPEMQGRVEFPGREGDGGGEGQGEFAFGYGEHCYLPTALVSFMVGNWKNESGPVPTLCVWYEPARGTWAGLLHSRLRRARAFVYAANLPELFSQLGARIAQDTLTWRGDRK